MVRNADSCYPRSHCLSKNIFVKIQTQGSTIKKFKLKKSRLKNLKPANYKTFALPYTNKLGKIPSYDKQKKYFKKSGIRKTLF